MRPSFRKVPIVGEKHWNEIEWKQILTGIKYLY